MTDIKEIMEKSYHKSLEELGIGQDYSYNECDFDDAGEAVWMGMFDFCGCGNWWVHLDTLLSTLHKMDLWHTANELPNYAPEEELWLYFLNLHEFAEHGSSVFGSWLSEKGKHLKCVLEVWRKETMEFGDNEIEK